MTANNGSAATQHHQQQHQHQHQQTIGGSVTTKMENFTTQIGETIQTTISTSLEYVRRFSFETLYLNIKSVLRNARLIKPITITCGLMIFQRLTGDLIWLFFSL